MRSPKWDKRSEAYRKMDGEVHFETKEVMPISNQVYYPREF
ncbi:hypothetical protein UF75_4318 [Desulfosporosinus sp. I2]|nr:hypothetical protein [Desulfosporosinus sp. I2]KJR45286.1 hypothetical protein UF75_4318 [Desulfosporosinus sp. I2]